VLLKNPTVNRPQVVATVNVVVATARVAELNVRTGL
jgi:hypothetical protein